MSAAAAGSRVTLGHGGVVRGRRGDGVDAFLGIPYAATPVGELRLRAPQPNPGWAGERDATAYGPTAPKGDYPAPIQPILPEVTIPGDEWLNLNVWTPSKPAPTGSGHPVMVWIHGGSFVNGSGSLPEYEGTAFARDGIVCVTINYRLGAEGFADLPDAEPNRGLLDMLAALRWVAQEIAAFGGDPERVTVAGESAGAMAICCLLAMDDSRGLFAQAILDSPSTPPAQSRDEAARVAAALSQQAGVPATRAALLALTPEALAQATTQTSVATRRPPTEFGPIPFDPVIDGDALPVDPLIAARRGDGDAIPLLLSSTHDEGRLFMIPFGFDAAVDDAALGLVARAGGLSEAGLAAYRAAARPGDGPGDVLAAVLTDRRFQRLILELAEIRAGRGARSWMARFDALASADNGGLRSCHACDLPFAFATTGRPQQRALVGSAPPPAAVDAYHGAWVAFIRDGDPGWPAYELSERRTGLFTADGLDVVSDPDAELRRAWPAPAA